MITTRWQFSLKGFLFGIALYAAFLTVAIFFPAVAIAVFVVAFLMFSGAVLAIISDRVPTLAHIILILFAGATYLVFALLVAEVGLIGLTLDCWR